MSTYSSAMYNFVPQFALDFYQDVRNQDRAAVNRKLNDFVIPYLERLADVLPYPTNYVLAALIILFVIFSEMGGGKKEPSMKGGEAAA